MKMTFAFGALVTAITVSSAGAATFTFPFTNPTGDLGSSTHAYTVVVGSAQATITASTLVASGPAPDLWGKNLGTDENGLGTAGNTDDEIVPTDAIVLDFSKILGVSSIGIQMASVQSASSDKWSLYGSNTAPTFASPGTALLLNQTSDQQLTSSYLSIATGYKYYTIEVPLVVNCSPDVLLGGIQVMATGNAPEPGTWAMMGVAALGLLVARKQRRA